MRHSPFLAFSVDFGEHIVSNICDTQRQSECDAKYSCICSATLIETENWNGMNSLLGGKYSVSTGSETNQLMRERSPNIRSNIFHANNIPPTHYLSRGQTGGKKAGNKIWNHNKCTEYRSVKKLMAKNSVQK